ncbi:hypothetical protein D1007_18057 [Hordeum vulgare]|nr:hypothetical protein D1007_18057 [Hordeum vulgare]
MDDLLLQEVDNELTNSQDEPLDDANLIRSVQVSTAWTNCRDQLANDMFAEYLMRHAELELETMAEGGDNGLEKFGRDYLTWTDEMDIALLEVLVEHHNNGDHAQNGWKSHVYVAVITNVREKCNVTITKENIILRCKTFEKHYEAISKMRSQSGFGWDWVNNKLSIDSEDVWTKYVVANNKIAFYKNRVIKNWDAITTIYSNDHANGEGVGTSSFHDAMKSLEPLTMPRVTPPAKILATLEMIR